MTVVADVLTAEQVQDRLLLCEHTALQEVARSHEALRTRIEVEVELRKAAYWRIEQLEALLEAAREVVAGAERDLPEWFDEDPDALDSEYRYFIRLRSALAVLGHATPAAADKPASIESLLDEDDLAVIAMDNAPVLGRCPHGVDLDINLCPEGCRV